MTNQLPPGAQGEILWDCFGVPHVFGKDEAAVYYGFGWAQAHNHGDILLRLYGEARGRAAEYWGESYIAADRWTLSNDVPARAARWYGAATANFRENLDAFALGINDFARTNPGKIDAAVICVLPVTGIDVMAHAHRLMNYIYIAPAEKTLGAAAPPAKAGSNAWAVAPSKSASGNAMLLANPHLPWAKGHFTYFEADLHGPDFHMYGATQVGLPVLRFLFNERMGFTNTINAMLGATNYELKPSGDGYLFDGEVLAFDVRTIGYKVKQADGSLKTEELVIRSSVHGPVFARADGRLVALRVAGLDRSGVLEQYWDMGKSKSFVEFRATMQRLQIPMFNIVYADKEGHISYVHNGILPKHHSGDTAYWSALVPGDTSETLWNDVHIYDDLPEVIDPPTGWVQNCNDPPWLATYPPVIRHADYPPYMAVPGPEGFRPQKSIHLLHDVGKISFEEFVDRKLSTQVLMADRVLPDLIDAAKADPDPEVSAAAALLRDWDRDTNSESRGALLFEGWAVKFLLNGSQAKYRTPWSADAPIETPIGIADPANAILLLRETIAEAKASYGAIDRPFGEVSRFQIDDVDLSGLGGRDSTGIFSPIHWSAPKDGKRTPLHGETWVSIVEFSTPIKALGRMSYGNASQPGSPHRADQLKLLAGKNFRTLWTAREEIEQHLEKRTPI